MVHALELVLDGILDRDDLVEALVDLGNHRIKGRGLAAAGGSRDEQHAVGIQGQPAQLGYDPRLEAELLERKTGQLIREAALIEDAQYGILAEHARHHRNPEVDFPAFAARSKPAILRHAALGDVQFRHDLDAR